MAKKREPNEEPVDMEKADDVLSKMLNTKPIRYKDVVAAGRKRREEEKKKKE